MFSSLQTGEPWRSFRVGHEINDKKILLLGPFKVTKVIFFSALQEAMKRILKQQSHPYEVYNKRYKVIKSHLFYVRS